MNAITFKGVNKRYGRMKALDSLSFHIPAGTLCGFVGPNGAGKTTTFSLVGGFCRADDGEIDVLGGDFDPWRLKGLLGVLPQDADLGDRHTPFELLFHLGRLQGLARQAAAEEADRWLTDLHLGDRRSKPIGSLSHGMRRRVAVASAMIGQPALVLLDEPTAGLDPVEAQSLRDLLVKRPKSQTVVISSHNLDEIERICDWIVMVERGKCVGQGSLSEITGQGEWAIWRIAGTAPLQALATALPDHHFAAENDVIHHRAPPSANLDAASQVVMRILVEHGIGLREVRRGISLEQRFFNRSAS